VGFDARVTRGADYAALARDHVQHAQRDMERAALVVTDRAAKKAVRAMREEMSAAGLGRLGNALGSTSDLAKGRGVKQRANGGFSASGVVFIRSGSKRSRGAIDAYTQGAEIRPRRSRWLWFPSDEIQRVAGKGSNKRRLEPHNWAALGMEAKLGPLVRIKASNGNPLLIVRNVGVSAAGSRRSAKSLKRRGLPRKGQVAREFIVAFIAIPNTSRAARISVADIMQAISAEMPAEFNEELKKVVRK
jgi:hypothetical protein